MKLIFKGK